MHHLWIKCVCGHEGDIPAPESVLTLSRADILSRARCSRCGASYAVGMRLYWNTGADAMDGASVPGQVPDRDW